jgi:hypothetical protein
LSLYVARKLVRSLLFFLLPRLFGGGLPFSIVRAVSVSCVVYYALGGRSYAEEAAKPQDGTILCNLCLAKTKFESSRALQYFPLKSRIEEGCLEFKSLSLSSGG